MFGIIYPNTYVEVKEPIIFLAGPIGSAPKWHQEAIEFIMSKNLELIIASPSTTGHEKFTDYILEGDDTKWGRQRAWELHYIDLASKHGCLMFWLPGEAQHSCYKVYGGTTRLELGEAITDYKHDKSYRFCVGTNQQFPEAGPIHYDMLVKIPDKHASIKPTLEKTCEEAIMIVFEKVYKQN